MRHYRIPACKLRRYHYGTGSMKHIIKIVVAKDETYPGAAAAE